MSDQPKEQALTDRLRDWRVLGVFVGKDAWRVVFRHQKWEMNKFVVVKLFINHPTFSVKFWKGSFQKTVESWNMSRTDDYPSSVIARSLTSLLEVLDWSRDL